MIVRLKDAGRKADEIAADGFNSMIVRLKVVIPVRRHQKDIRFNSMIVRLKGNIRIGADGDNLLVSIL